jgi:hypothetical protein
MPSVNGALAIPAAVWGSRAPRAKTWPPLDDESHRAIRPGFTSVKPARPRHDSAVVGEPAANMKQLAALTGGRAKMAVVESRNSASSVAAWLRVAVRAVI